MTLVNNLATAPAPAPPPRIRADASLAQFDAALAELSRAPVAPPRSQRTIREPAPVAPPRPLWTLQGPAPVAPPRRQEPATYLNGRLLPPGADLFEALEAENQRFLEAALKAEEQRFYINDDCYTEDEDDEDSDDEEEDD
jgi:hypothetical protein